MVATIGLQLDPLDSMYDWREEAKTRGVTPWYFAAELVAAEQRHSPSSAPILKGAAERRLTELGIEHGANPFYDGGIAAKWTDVPINLGYPVDPVTSCYTQARLYTFLAYRRGFAATLATNPFTAEQAVHAYVRVALSWVEQWPGLTLATGSEQEREQDELRDLKKRERLTAQHRYESSFALPTILEDDLHDLAVAYDRGESAQNAHRGGTPSTNAGAPKAVAQLLVGQIRRAAIEMIKDPSLRVLSAYNMVRATANSELGGALARARLSAGDFVLATVDQGVRSDLLSGAWKKFPLDKQQAMLSAAPVWGLMLGKPDTGTAPQ